MSVGALLVVLGAVIDSEWPALDAPKGGCSVLTSGGDQLDAAWGRYEGRALLAVAEDDYITAGAARGLTPWSAWPAELGQGPGGCLGAWASALALDRLRLPAGLAVELTAGRRA